MRYLILFAVLEYHQCGRTPEPVEPSSIECNEAHTVCVERAQ